jgi:hypothetical protein
MIDDMQLTGSPASNDGQPAANNSPAPDRTQETEELAGSQLEPPPGKLNRPHKPFSLKNLGSSMTHLPLTPAGARHAGQWMMGHRSNPSSPANSEFNEKNGDYFGEKMSRTSTFMSEDDRKRKEWEQEKKKRKKAKEKKKEQEIFVSQCVQFGRKMRISNVVSPIATRSFNMSQLSSLASNSSSSSHEHS